MKTDYRNRGIGRKPFHICIYNVKELSEKIALKCTETQYMVVIYGKCIVCLRQKFPMATRKSKKKMKTYGL